LNWFYSFCELNLDGQVTILHRHQSPGLSMTILVLAVTLFT